MVISNKYPRRTAAIIMTAKPVNKSEGRTNACFIKTFAGRRAQGVVSGKLPSELLKCTYAIVG